MNLRTYLRLLRPVRSLLVIAFYTFTASTFGHLLFRLDEATSRFLALAIALPLLLGFAIAGAAHEPMHRAFFLLLPDGPRRLRKATLLAVVVFAFAVTGAVAYVEPSVPPFATLGLSAGLIALFCIERHQHIAGLGGCGVAFWGWLLFNLTASGLLRPAMMAAPWAFLLCGFALTATSLASGFSRRHLRQRTETPYASIQSLLFSHLFDSRLAARRMEEMALHRNRRAKTGFPVGRDWPVRSVGSSTRAWMQVIWHAVAGRRRHNNFLKFQLSIAVPVIAGGLVFPLITGYLTSHSFSLSDYWRLLATMAAPENMLPMSLDAEAGWVVGGMMQVGAAALSMFMVVSPQLAYPISRERLARVVFGLSLVQLAAALAFPAAAFFLLSLVGQIASGYFWPGFGLPSIVALDLALAVGLPLLACAGSFRRGAVRILWVIPVGFAIFIAVLTRGSWVPHALTVSGIAVIVLAASVNVGLLWLCLRHHYRTCDLFSGSGQFNARF